MAPRPGCHARVRARLEEVGVALLGRPTREVGVGTARPRDETLLASPCSVAERANLQPASASAVRVTIPRARGRTQRTGAAGRQEEARRHGDVVGDQRPGVARARVGGGRARIGAAAGEGRNVLDGSFSVPVESLRTRRSPTKLAGPPSARKMFPVTLMMSFGFVENRLTLIVQRSLPRSLLTRSSADRERAWHPSVRWHRSP